jgi:hypothetical protein
MMIVTCKSFLCALGCLNPFPHDSLTSGLQFLGDIMSENVCKLHAQIKRLKLKQHAIFAQVVADAIT